MRVLITGGSGFLGSRLALRHLAAGDQVRVLAREATPLESANAQTLRNHGADVVIGDVSDEGAVKFCLKDIDRVYHIAAAMREANVGDDHFWEVNFRATQRLVRSSAEAGVKRFLYCSTAGVVGPTHGQKTDEETECHPKDIYQVTKCAAEQWVLTYARDSKYPLSAVRPCGVYGPGDGRLLKLFDMIRRGKFVMIGSGTGLHHWVYIDDLLDGMQLAAEKEQAVGRVYNLSDDHPIALNDLVNEIARQFGVAPPKLRLPFGPMKALSFAVEMICRPLGVQPPLYRRRLDFFAHDDHFDNARAKRELGWQPKVDIREGIARTIAYYRGIGWLPAAEAAPAGVEAVAADRLKTAAGASRERIGEAGTIRLERPAGNEPAAAEKQPAQG